MHRNRKNFSEKNISPAPFFLEKHEKINLLEKSKSLGYVVDPFGAFPILSTHTSALLKEKQQKNSQLRRRQLRAWTLSNALKEAIVCSKGSMDNSVVFEEASRIYAHKTAMQMIQSRPFVKANNHQNEEGFLGLSLMSLPEAGEKYTNPMEAEAVVCARVEKIIQERAQVVAAFSNSVTEQNSDTGIPSGYPQIATLPAQIKAIQEKIKSEQAFLQDNMIELNKLVQETLKVTIEKLGIVLHLADLKLQKQTPIDTMQVQHFLAWFNTLCAKIAVMRVQIQAETYTSKTIPALLIIRQLVDSKLDEIKLESNKIQARLMKYNCAGPEMRGIAAEYHNIKKQITEKQCYLERLNRF